MKRVEVLPLRPVPQGQAHTDPLDSTDHPVILDLALRVIKDRVHHLMVPQAPVNMDHQVRMAPLAPVNTDRRVHKAPQDLGHTAPLDNMVLQALDHMAPLDPDNTGHQDRVNMAPLVLALMGHQAQAHTGPLDPANMDPLDLIRMDLQAQVVRPLKDTPATQAPILPTVVPTPAVHPLQDPVDRPQDQAALQVVLDIPAPGIVDPRPTEQWGTLDPRGDHPPVRLAVLSRVLQDPLDRQEQCVLLGPTALRPRTFRNCRTPSMPWRSEA